MFDVIIPIYRIDPALLQRCLDSVYAQSLPSTQYNVWVVEGTPTDADTYQGCKRTTMLKAAVDEGHGVLVVQAT